MTTSVTEPISKDRAGPRASPTNFGIAIALLAVGIVIRILSFVASRNTGGDALARVALTAKWLQHPTLKVIFDSYPPGHFWLIGGLTLLVHDVGLAGRLLSLLFGIGSLFLVWKLAVMLYGDTAGIFSLAVMCLYTMHIAYSTTSSSEVSYLFFLLASFFMLFSYLRAEPGNLWYLVFSGLSLSISESVRFEAWVFFLWHGTCIWNPGSLDFRPSRKIVESLSSSFCFRDYWRSLARFHDGLLLPQVRRSNVSAELDSGPRAAVARGATKFRWLSVIAHAGCFTY